MRRWYVLVIIVLLGLAATACARKPLLSDVSFNKDLITPNADRDNDVLLITFRLSRSAYLSIYFDDAAGHRYWFRNRVYHGPSAEVPYQVYFAGVVDGYTLPGEQFMGFAVTKRVLQNGAYTCRGLPSVLPARSPSPRPTRSCPNYAALAFTRRSLPLTGTRSATGRRSMSLFRRT